MFAMSRCARYQQNPKESHPLPFKRIFWYLKHTPNLGLWYPRDSKFNVVGYIDFDYACCSLDINSTSDGCQILEIDWSVGQARNNHQWIFQKLKLNMLLLVDAMLKFYEFETYFYIMISSFQIFPSAMTTPVLFLSLKSFLALQDKAYRDKASFHHGLHAKGKDRVDVNTNCQSTSW